MDLKNVFCITLSVLQQIWFVYFQPDISKFASDILPLLFDYLGQASGKADPPGISRTYYALETFCENLGKLIQIADVITVLGKWVK
jgi:hypothetical protein